MNFHCTTQVLSSWETTAVTEREIEPATRLIRHYRALQEAADKANAQFAAVKKTNQKSEEWETRQRSSNGRRVCGAFNYFGCNKGDKCSYEHSNSREAMAR